MYACGQLTCSRQLPLVVGSEDDDDRSLSREAGSPSPLRLRGGTFKDLKFPEMLWRILTSHLLSNFDACRKTLRPKVPKK